MILVAGGTGTLGTFLVGSLRARQLPVRVLTRDRERAAHLASEGVELAIGDVGDPEAVAAAMAGVSTVVSAVQGFAGPGDVSPQTVDRAGNANLIEAAEGAGVGHFILTSVVGAAPDSPLELFRAKHDAEQQLRSSGLAWTIVRATAFMETWITIIGEPMRTKGTTMVFGRGHNPINFVSASDVAALIERAITDLSLKGRILELGGPDNLTFNELAATLQQITDWHGAVRHVPRPMLRAMSIVMGVVKPALARQTRAALVMDTQDFSFDAAETRRDLPGLPNTDLTVAVKRQLDLGI